VLERKEDIEKDRGGKNDIQTEKVTKEEQKERH
jgi:hypothetical protein